MTVLSPPAYLQAGTYTALSDRQHMITARVMKDLADNSRARNGLLPDNAAWSAPESHTGFNVSVGPFRAIVTNTFTASGGDYEVISTGTETRTLTGSSPTTNRIDCIGVQVKDAFYSGAVNNADVTVIQGLASAGTPAPPALPLGFLPLYHLTVSASSTQPVVTDLRNRTAPVGAVVPAFAIQSAQGGSYVGEKRIMPASGVLPMREMYWGADAAWHGLNSFSLRFPTFATGNFTVSSVLSTLNFPDPGYSYNVVMSGAVWGQLLGAGGWWIKCYNGAPGGGQVVSVPAIFQNFTTYASYPVAGGSENVMTGPANLQCWTEPPFGGPGINIRPESSITVTVVPA